jgi:lipid II:glycine glycyltransferase (peptidoglycan interpeptide bridge formation enzyme)
MEIRDDIDRKIWNEFVAALPNSPILQSWEWGEVKAASGWEPIRIAVTEGGQIRAAIQILKRSFLFYAPRGPVLDFKDEAALDFLLSEVRKLAKKHKAVALKIDPEVEENDPAVPILIKRGFIPQKKQVQPRATLYLDLTRSLDDLLASFEEKTRYNIRLSAKKGVKVSRFQGIEGVEIFHNIYQETARRDNFLIHPRSYYQKIMEIMGPQQMARVFVAYLGDEPIAAVLVFCFGNRVWYMYGSSKSEHREVMPNHALHWEVIKWAKEKGYKLYDLWGIPANPDPNHPLWGVYRFKKGFKGRQVNLIGACDLVYDPLFYNLFNKGLAWYQNLRSLLTKGKISDSLGE